MTDRTAFAYLVSATTEDGAERRSVHLSPTRARAKLATWRARGWSAELHRISAECLDCGGPAR